jgi:hypothetical protein
LDPGQVLLRADHERDVHNNTKECGCDARAILQLDWNTRSLLQLELVVQETQIGMHSLILRKLPRSTAKNHFTFEEDPMVAKSLARETNWHRWHVGKTLDQLPSNYQVTPRFAVPKKPRPETPNVPRAPRTVNHPSKNKKGGMAINMLSRKTRLVLDGTKETALHVFEHLLHNDQREKLGLPRWQINMLTIDYVDGFPAFKTVLGHHYLSGISVKASMLLLVLEELGDEVNNHFDEDEVHMLRSVKPDSRVYGTLAMLDNGTDTNPTKQGKSADMDRESLSRDLDKVRPNIWKLQNLPRTDRDDDAKIHVDDVTVVSFAPWSQIVENTVLKHYEDRSMKVAKLTHGSNQISTGTGYNFEKAATTGEIRIYLPTDKQVSTRERVQELVSDRKPTLNMWEKMIGKIVHAFQLVVADVDSIMNIMCLNLKQRRATVDKSATKPNKMCSTTCQQWPRKPEFAPAKTRIALQCLLDMFEPATDSQETWSFDLKQFVALKHGHERATPRQVWLIRWDVSQGRSKEAEDTKWPTVGFTVRRIDAGAVRPDAMWGSVQLSIEVFLLGFRKEKSSSECLERIGGHLVTKQLGKVRDLRGCLMLTNNDNKGVTSGAKHELVTYMVDCLSKVDQVRLGFRQIHEHKKRSLMANLDALSKGNKTHTKQMGEEWRSLPLDEFVSNMGRHRKIVKAWVPAQKVVRQTKYRHALMRDQLPDGWATSPDTTHLTRMLCINPTVDLRSPDNNRRSASPEAEDDGAAAVLPVSAAVGVSNL